MEEEEEKEESKGGFWEYKNKLLIELLELSPSPLFSQDEEEEEMEAEGGLWESGNELIELLELLSNEWGDVDWDTEKEIRTVGHETGVKRLDDTLSSNPLIVVFWSLLL
jgi:hypothetical protein